MKNKNKEKTEHTGSAEGAGYGGQDFEQGRAGLQSGHEDQADTFSQFQNSGNAGFAAERTANSNALRTDTEGDSKK